MSIFDYWYNFLIRNGDFISGEDGSKKRHMWVWKTKSHQYFAAYQINEKKKIFLKFIAASRLRKNGSSIKNSLVWFNSFDHFDCQHENFRTLCKPILQYKEQK